MPIGKWQRMLAGAVVLVGYSSLASAQQPADTQPAIGVEQATGTGQDADELSRQATDPTASLMSLGLSTTYTGGYHGNQPDQPDDAWQLKFQPVIPFKAFDLPNILRISMPYQTGGRGEEGLGDVSIFNLTIFNETWGRWGVGPVMTFATDDDAKDDFVIGPAVGFVYQVSKRLNVGLFNQNVFGHDTAISQLQPILAYQLGDGWSLSLGDLQFIYDWERERWLNVPVGFQIGKVIRIGGQAVRFAVNPQYNLIDDDGLEQWKVGFSMTFLFPSK